MGYGFPYIRYGGRVGLGYVSVSIYTVDRVGLRIGFHIYGMRVEKGWVTYRYPYIRYGGRVGLGYVSVSIYTVWG